MAKLKPIGSEKLEGTEKLKRIMEIANYQMPSSTLSESKSDYSIGLSDGHHYHIVKEKQGYIIKRGLNESSLDYMGPIKNRKYYTSYSQALKKLNLIIKETNELNGESEEVKLFGEQKKFVLKTPTPPAPAPEMDIPAVPAEPMALPEPELPSPDMGGADEIDAEMNLDMEVPADEPADMGQELEDKVSFKLIQKLTGNLTQKMRALEDQEGMTSENIKYVINMVLSALDLTKLEPEDMEDIMSKFEDMEADVEMEEPGMGGDELDLNMDAEVSMEEPMEGMGSEDYDFNLSIGESKIDRVLSKYFEVSDSEVELSKKLFEGRQIEKNNKINSFNSKIENLSETIEQELAGKKFLEENTDFEFVGKTNKKNLVFENQNKQIRISVEGIVL